MQKDILIKVANAIRFLTLDAVEQAASGHPGMPLGMAELASVLFTEHLRFNPQDPSWSNRDRFILSNGHGSMLLYSMLYLFGYEKMDIEQLKSFRTLPSIATGHPELDVNAGIETTTGPLGQGIANAVGIAIAERHMNAKCGGKGAADHFTYVFCGDGCLMEGVAQEAIALAGHLRLHKLILVFDDNQITIDGRVDLTSSTDITKLFAAHNWNVISIDGHDLEQINEAFIEAKHNTNSPSVICARTIIGKGLYSKSDTAACHGSPVGELELSKTRALLDWPYPPFHIPETILQYCRGIYKKHIDHYTQSKNLTSDAHCDDKYTQSKGLTTDAHCDVSVGCIRKNIYDFIQQDTRGLISTRQASGDILDLLMDSEYNLLVGSADLSKPNCTNPKKLHPFTHENYVANYLHYGAREHAMAAIMNGVALNKGIVPIGATFLAFSDYARPAIRLASMMRLRAIFIFTHDSIGLGEDGPTHQPIEQLMGLRMIPGLQVLRPADIAEVAWSYLEALRYDGPSCIVLSRQSLPRLHDTAQNVQNINHLKKSATKAECAIVGTGSEVHLAMEVAQTLSTTYGIDADVYSVISANCSCIKLDLPIFTIEASSTIGWGDYVKGIFVHSFGIDGFGKSAPCKDVYNYFELNAKSIAQVIQTKLR